MYGIVKLGNKLKGDQATVTSMPSKMDDRIAALKTDSERYQFMCRALEKLIEWHNSEQIRLWPGGVTEKTTVAYKEWFQKEYAPRLHSISGELVKHRSLALAGFNKEERPDNQSEATAEHERIKTLGKADKTYNEDIPIEDLGK